MDSVIANAIRIYRERYPARDDSYLVEHLLFSYHGQVPSREKARELIAAYDRQFAAKQG